MNTALDRVRARSCVFAWIALVACALWLIPLVAMQFTTEVDWHIADFAVMGFLLFAAGSVFVIVARRGLPGTGRWSGLWSLLRSSAFGRKAQSGSIRIWVAELPCGLPSIGCHRHSAQFLGGAPHPPINLIDSAYAWTAGAICRYWR